jgi:predicted dehydrogenase
VNVAIVGAGFMGKTHATIYAKLQNAKVVAVADISPTRAKEIADLSDAKIYGSLREMLNDYRIDIVDICLPTYMHAENVIEAARSGKHILCEKPIAINLEQADAMIETAKEAKVNFMVAHVIRFWPEYMTLKHIVDNKTLGKIRSLSCVRLSSAPGWSWKSWITQQSLSGSAVIDLHIHDVDYIIYLLGKPLSVFSHGTPDHIFTLYEFPTKKTTAFAEGGWDLPSNFPFRMAYSSVFEKGLVEFQSDLTVEPLRVFPIDGEKYIPEMPTLVFGKSRTVGNISELAGYYNEIKYFVDCVDRRLKPTICAPEDARIALEVSLKEIESVETGKKIPL